MLYNRPIMNYRVSAHNRDTGEWTQKDFEKAASARKCAHAYLENGLKNDLNQFVKLEKL